MFIFVIFRHCYSQHFSFPNDSTPHTLKIIEKNMATLNLSGSQPPREFEKPTETMTFTGNGIGARIMRRLRQNSTETSKPKIDVRKQKNLNPNSKAIERLYLNKTLGRVKNTQLETIFELEENATNFNESDLIDGKKVFGKKNKRSVSCTDGLNASKTLKEKRKRRIKKIFGRTKKSFKRISMKNFLERLQSSDTAEIVASQSIIGA